MDIIAIIQTRDDSGLDHVVTGKDEKRSDFGYGSNPVQAEIAEELDLRHKREVEDDSKI